jgi:hypothetical protein
MTKNANIQTQRLGRVSGFLYLWIVICGFWSLMYVPSKVGGKGDPGATMQNLLANEFLFRSGTIANLSSFVVFIFLVLALYQIFKNTNEPRAKLMVAFVIVQVPIVFLGETFNFSALMVAKGDLMQSLTQTERADWVYFLLRVYKYTLIILMIFWGLWLIPFGQLIIQSGYMPKTIGVLLVLGGIAYVVESVDYILLSRMLSPLTDYTYILHSIAELSTVLWLLAKGIKPNK